MILGLATALFYDAAVLTELRGVLGRFPILGVSIEDLYLGQTTASVAGGRVYMPGRALVQLLFFPALLAMLLAADAARTRRYGLISLAFGATIVLIMTRAVWVTTIVVLGVTMLLVDRQRRFRLMQLCMGIVALALVVVISLRVFSLSPLNLSPEVFGERFMTVVTDNFDDPTLQYRISEASAVLQRSAQNWLTGVGFWAPIGSQLAYDQNADSIVARDVFAWHNGYLSLLLATGLVGLSFFVLLWLAVVRHCYACIQFGKTRLIDPFVVAITLGFGLSLVRILLNGFTESVFTDSFTVPLIAMGAAVLERGVEFQRSAPLRAD
jgi:O-antigen ligase